MGQLLATWTAQVQAYVRDAGGVDVTTQQAVSVGITPALAQYSIDRPRVVAADLTPAARYLPLPTAPNGWIDGFSRVLSIEAPAGETPPQTLRQGSWMFARDPVVVATTRILLPWELAAGDVARVEFTTAWPTPTTDAAIDLVSSVAFPAVTALAAAMVLNTMAAEAARSRQGAMPTDFVDGTERALRFQESAANLRILYNTMIGLGAAQGGSDSSKSLQSIRCTIG